jgi:hypothetical protein
MPRKYVRGQKQPPGTGVKVSPMTEWTDHGGINELFGLKRSTAYHLEKDGLIQSISLRKPGEKRAKRLFNVASVRQYFASRIGKP